MPVIAIGLQLVGLNWKPRAGRDHVDVLDLHGDPVDQVRDRIAVVPGGFGRDRQRRGERVDFDLAPARRRSHTPGSEPGFALSRSQIERAGLHRSSTTERPNGAP